MNDAAIGWLQMLRVEVERADMVSIQLLSPTYIQEAAALIVHTDTTPAAEARAREAVFRFRATMEADLTGRSEAVEQARAAALQAIDTYATRVRSAPASIVARNLDL